MLTYFVSLKALFKFSLILLISEIQGHRERMKEIKSEGRMIGCKRALVIYQGSHPHEFKTNWIMHEFRVADDNMRVTFDD